MRKIVEEAVASIVLLMLILSLTDTVGRRQEASTNMDGRTDGRMDQQMKMGEDKG